MLTAADLDAWAVPLAAVKAADTSRTSVTTVTADPDLSLAVAANALYRFWMYLDYEGANTGTGDLKWSFSTPSGATLRYQALFLQSGGGTAINQTIGFTNTGASVMSAASNGVANLMAVTMWGQLDTAASTGSLTLNWAQNTSSATSTIVHAQSSMTLDRIG